MILRVNAEATTRHTLGLAVLAAISISGCAANPHPVVPDQFVALNTHPLRLHFENSEAPAARPLLVYATGDGGMHRKDLDTYRHLAASGNPIVGFDARDYVKHLGKDTPTTTPERLAADYREIILRARQVLGLDRHCPVVLVGVSRGAGLSVVAAGQLRESITGVVAVALTQEEEYVRWYRHLPLPHEARPVMVDVYEYLSQLGDLPVAVVQSTRDKYLPAEKAREQFGPDTPYRWLQAIDASNHNFSGARTRMYEAVRSALDWVVTARATAPAYARFRRGLAGALRAEAEAGVAQQRARERVGESPPSPGTDSTGLWRGLAVALAKADEGRRPSVKASGL